VNAFDVKEPKTKQFRAALDALKVDSTALLVEEGKNQNRNLELSSRNLDGLELVRGHEVHPYHLLRYDRVIFSQPAIEKLQASLVNSVSKRKSAAAEGNGEKKAARAPRKRARSEKAAEVA
jgi:large subunit ribosomal protein L4